MEDHQGREYTSEIALAVYEANEATLFFSRLDRFEECLDDEIAEGPIDSEDVLECRSESKVDKRKARKKK